MEALMACYQRELLYLIALAGEEIQGGEEGGDEGLPRPAAALPGSAMTPATLAG